MDIAPGNAGPTEFRLFLQDELVRRCKKNPRFSLRAFARALAIEPSALSKILHGKRALTPKMLNRIATQLGMSDEEIRRFEPASKTTSTRPAKPASETNSGGAQRSNGSIHKSVPLSIARQLLPKAEILIERFHKDLIALAAADESGEQDAYQLDVIIAPRN